MRKLVFVVCLAVLLPNCSSSPTPVTTTTTTTTLPPCTQSVVFQASGPAPSRVLVFNTFTVASTGRLDVVVDWTFASSQIGVYVVPLGQCTLDQFNARSCNFLLRSETTTKPRKASVPGIAPGSYELLIGNFASQDESVSAQLTVSSSNCPPLAVAPVGSTAFAGQMKGIVARH